MIDLHPDSSEQLTSHREAIHRYIGPRMTDTPERPVWIERLRRRDAKLDSRLENKGRSPAFRDRVPHAGASCPPGELTRPASARSNRPGHRTDAVPGIVR